MGSGQQWMSWLTLNEAMGIEKFALASSALSGPVNAVAPQPVQNKDFTRILARALRRAALFPIPVFALRVALGEMADALLLVSHPVVPTKLQQAGYRFAHPDLGTALEEVLRKRA